MPNRFSKVDAQQVALLGGNAKMASDPKRNQTVLHLSTLGAIRGEQNNTFVDDSPNRFAITRTGNVAPSTFSPYGDSWSNYFDGNGDYLSFAAGASSTISFGAGDFTFETWFNFSSIGNQGLASILTSRTTADAANEISIYLVGTANTSNATGIQFGYWTSPGAVTQFNFASSASPAANVWHHLAITRSNSTIRVFLNGSQIGSSTYSGNISTTGVFDIGRINAGDVGVNFLRYFNGNISNLRIVKGTALYTTDFTPSKTPLTAVSGTSLLTCASNRFQDKSSNNFTITPAGNVAVKTASPFPQTREFRKPQRGWCVPFNGSTQRLETPAASVANGLQLGTSDFTIECWVKAKPQGAYSRVIDTGAYGNPNYGFILSTRGTTTDTGLEFAMYTGNTVNYVSVLLPNVLDNTWKHVAIVRSGDTLYGYVDGILAQTASIGVNTRNLNFVTPVTIGVYKSPTNSIYSNYFSGKISNVMIVKKALYSGNFVPMGSPRAADQNGTLPVLLTCQGPNIYDYSYSFLTLTSAGSLVVDSDGPFDQDDELSYYFDGNGDYLSIADNAALELGSGDFTIEAWINPTAYSTYDGSRYTSTIAAKENSYYIQINGATASNFTSISFSGYNGTTYIEQTSSFSFNLNTWYHVVATRQSGTLNLFVNGALLNSFASYTHTLQNNVNALMVGSTMGTIRNFTGYISNFRLVTGAALYTANFTPSRKPLGIATSGSTALLTCMGRTAADQSNNNLTVTTNGNAGVASLSPFRSLDYNGMSYYFDGNGDFFTATPGASTDITATDFTVSLWVYPTVTGVRQDIFSQRPASGNFGWVIGTDATGKFGITYIGGTAYVTPSAIPIGCWTHLTVVRSGTNLKIFQNGSSVVNVTTANGGATTATLYISRNAQAANYYYQGFLSDVRIVKGVPLYTANFTPPSIPTLPVPSTQLLLNAYPAIYDATRKNAIETVGSYAAANVGTPWGKTAERYSYNSSGAGDYLNIPSSQEDFDFGTGDFTIEAWVNFYSAGNHAVVSYAAHGATAGASNACWYLGRYQGKIDACFWSGSTVYACPTTATLNDNTWYHLAFVKKSGTLYSFVNGVLDGTLTANASINTPANRTVRVGGGYFNTLLNLSGAVHDLRITKGVARYTSNFTMPLLHPIK